MGPRFVAVIGQVSMALGHDGLGLVAKKFRVDMARLEDHELVLFINKARDKLKILGAKGVVLGYVRMAKGRKLPLEAVQFIPQTFSNDGKINVDAAIDEYIRNRLAQKSVKSPLEIVRATRA